MSEPPAITSSTSWARSVCAPCHSGRLLPRGSTPDGAHDANVAASLYPRVVVCITPDASYQRTR
ncbi:MAG: hypothetical protein U0Y82_10680 [Thermoleophilia bacterium]